MRTGRTLPGRAPRRAVFWLFCCTLVVGVGTAAEPRDLTGTWVLDDAASDDPALIIREESSQAGGSGAGRGVLRGINVFGIPVGDLPLPPGSSDESSPEEAFAAAAHVLAAITEIRILQEPAATEIEYSDGTTATYRHGIPDERDESTVAADWDDDVFEVVHELDNRGKVTELFRLDTATDELRWSARLKPKKGKVIEIERVFYLDDQRTGR